MASWKKKSTKPQHKFYTSKNCSHAKDIATILLTGGRFLLNGNNKYDYFVYKSHIMCLKMSTLHFP